VPRPEERCDAVAQIAHALRRCGHHERVRLERPLEVSGHEHSVRDRHSRQISGVLSPHRELVRSRGVARPEDDRASAVAGEDRRERRAPGACLENGYVDGDLRCPIRGSLPRMIRAMFGRCRIVTIEPAMRMKPNTAELNERYPVRTKST